MMTKTKAATAIESGVLQPDTLKLSIGGYSDAGAKDGNDDAFAAYTPEGSVKLIKGAVACIADGVSCSENSHIASQTSVTNFISDYYATPDSWSIRDSVSRVLKSLNNWLFSQGGLLNRNDDAYVTTFTAAVIKSTTAHIFHAGDTRAYLLRDNKLELLTQDHCRFLAGNKSHLVRALGIDTRLEMDYLPTELKQGDVLFLSTDGVHEFVQEQDIIALAQSPSLSWEEKAKAIAVKALAGGSDDNVTCLLVSVDELPLEDINESHRALTELIIPPVLDVGMKIDGYEVLKVLYSGTRSHVYLVKHPNYQRPLILKAPSENFTEDAQYLEGFIREQWVGRKLNSPYVMKILPHDGEKFLYHLCEYVEGETLRQWMLEHPLPSLNSVRDLLQEIIRGLRVFQRAGMVHRDLKPENIVIGNDGKVKIIDLGTVQVDSLEEVGSVLENGVPVGSVNYIAPEYLLGGHGVFQSDLFSLGVITYEMLTGSVPYALENAHRSPPKQLHQWHYQSLKTKRKDLPAWVDMVLEKACNPSVARRYPAYSEFLHDLTKPNPVMLRQINQAPLMERHPERFWMVVSAILFLLVMVQAYLLVAAG
ncbi:bifunctional protein-serine/threonine kinase/phosphatase [Halioxenophilus aromaticivorans]|uniref:Bifunctional protein-serine/threonine kinase/phosphatase n=1 Tax=Halioxenophilus aromaticivorans TaxID=1306992 RepID=A0AAV3U4X6_9ALTE